MKRTALAFLMIAFTAAGLLVLVRRSSQTPPRMAATSDIRVAGIQLDEPLSQVQADYPRLKEVAPNNWVQPHGSDDYCDLGSIGFVEGRVAEVFGYTLEVQSKRFHREDHIAEVEKVLGPYDFVKAKEQEGSKLYRFKNFPLQVEVKDADSTMRGGFYLQR